MHKAAGPFPKTFSGPGLVARRDFNHLDGRRPLFARALPGGTLIVNMRFRRKVGLSRFSILSALLRPASESSRAEATVGEGIRGRTGVCRGITGDRPRTMSWRHRSDGGSLFTYFIMC